MTDARAHVASLVAALEAVRDDLPRVDAWGVRVAGTCGRGGRLLAAGNGGSAAQAQHLTAELVGRYRAERGPLSALALHAETSSLTAIVNDYGPDAAFARQVHAHGRPGDLLLLISTSGRSPNLLAAADAGAQAGLVCWSLTGPAPNPLADATAEHVAVPGETPTVQEVHQVLIHLLCEAVDRALAPEPA